LKELPLAYISFYYLTQVFYLNSMPELNSYILILNIVYFSFSGVFICILIEFKQDLSNDELVGDDSALSLFKKLLFYRLQLVCKHEVILESKTVSG